MKKNIFILPLLALLLFSCEKDDKSTSTPPTINYFDITYKNNWSDSGTIEESTDEFKIGSKANLRANNGNLTKLGHTFSGWNTASDGSGTDYSAGAEVTIDQDVTLYPKWIHNYSENGPDSSAPLQTSTVNVNGSDKTHYYYFRVPSNYNADKSVSYPLVIWLHPWGISNDPDSLPSANGITPGDISALPSSDTYPAFFYTPVCPEPYDPARSPTAPDGGEWNSPEAKAMFVDKINDLRTRFNIDPRRIYVMGFSMGGAGSWYLSHAYYEQTGKYISAVVRAAGWYLMGGGGTNETDEKAQAINDVLAHSASWIQAGEVEGAGYTAAVANYNYIKSTYGNGTESSTRRTTADYLNGSDGLEADFYSMPLSTDKEIRLSIYIGDGHTSRIFRNNDVLEWLFSQSL